VTVCSANNCVLCSSWVRVGSIFSVWLVSGYAHVFIILSVVIVPHPFLLYWLTQLPICPIFCTSLHFTIALIITHNVADYTCPISVHSCFPNRIRSVDNFTRLSLLNTCVSRAFYTLVNCMHYAVFSWTSSYLYLSTAEVENYYFLLFNTSI